MAAPSSQATLKLFRDGAERSVNVILGELREDASTRPPPDEEPAAIDGLQLEQLTPRIARELELPADTTGVVVFDVEPDSLAAEAGLRASDIILEVDRRPATSVQMVERAIRNRRSEPVVLYVSRSGDTIYIVMDSR